jgi:hypothetical protein
MITRWLRFAESCRPGIKMRLLELVFDFQPSRFEEVALGVL